MMRRVRKTVIITLICLYTTEKWNIHEITRLFFFENFFWASRFWSGLVNLMNPLARLASGLKKFSQRLLKYTQIYSNTLKYTQIYTQIYLNILGIL